MSQNKAWHLAYKRSAFHVLRGVRAPPELDRWPAESRQAARRRRSVVSSASAQPVEGGIASKAVSPNLTIALTREAQEQESNQGL